jgi:hypothetical protein
VAADVALLDHGGCTRHRHYRLSCAQFDSLLAESTGRCQICHRQPRETSHGILCIDHWGPLWAVRGLLCGTCNATLGVLRDNWVMAREYLARPWWLRQCDTAGLPSDLRPEPPLGSAIRNQFDVIWVRRSTEPGGWWETPCQRGHRWTPLSWEHLYLTYGAHNLASFDLSALFAAELNEASPSARIRRELESGPYWASVLEAVRR